MKQKIISVFMVVIIAMCSLSVPASAAEKLAKPTVTVSAIADTTVKLKWNKIDGAEKYQIYYATKKDGTYKKYGSTSKTVITVKNLEAETKYYFKVRAIKTVDSKTSAGSFSAIKSATTRAAAKAEQEKAVTVYITQKGKKYHYDNQCNGANYFEVTMEEALRLKREPCEKCVNRNSKKS